MTRTRPARPFTLRLEPLEDRAVPATFNVTTTLDVVDPADGKRSLREAITAANNLAGSDVIVLPAGVYKLALAGAGEDANATGDLDVTGAVTIRGAGAGASIIDGQQLDRVFDVLGTAPSSIRVVLEKLTVRNGNAAGHGGATRLSNADLVVRDCVVSGNSASGSGGGISNGDAPGTGNVTIIRTTVGRNVSGNLGGGIHVAGNSVLTVKDSTIRRNNADFDGGGINATTANLTNSTVSGNNADFIGGGINATTANLTNSTVSGNSCGSSGGGIEAGTANLINSTVSGNNAPFNGGGIRASTATLTSSTVSGNSSGNNGGGILATAATLTNSTVNDNSAGTFGGSFGGGGGIFATATTNLTNSTVSGNTAGTFGGGISAATANLTNSTVSGNSSGNNGGGIRADTATLTNSTVSGNITLADGGGIWATTATLLSCTIAENIAGNGGGGIFHNPGGAFAVRNTIIALNLVGVTSTGRDVSGLFTSQGHNLIGDGSGGTGFTDGVNGDMVGTSVNPIDPKLGALKNNGGRTKTHALLAGSPTIDKGDNAAIPATDQRGAGFPRKKDGNFNGVAIVDIGAFEK